MLVCRSILRLLVLGLVKDRERTFVTLWALNGSLPSWLNLSRNVCGSLRADLPIDAKDGDDFVLVKGWGGESSLLDEVDAAECWPE